MDINYLLAIQSFREGWGSIFRDFFFQITNIGEMGTMLLFLAGVYWCVSKEFGSYLLVGYNWNRIVNGLLKIHFCVYRPWIRSSLIVPDAEVMKTATGYSFPSGHSMNGASLFGGVAIRKDMKKALRIVAGIMVVLIAFSRNYFSVHTPQDVLVGPALGLLVMFGASKAMPLLKKKNADLVMAVVTLIVGVLVIVYATVKSYPTDFDAEGKLIVDGVKMAADTYKGVGWNFGFFIGFILERRFVRFSTDCDMQTRLLRLIAGIVIFYLANYTLCPMVKTAIGGNFGTLASCAIQMLFITLIIPAGFKMLEKKA